MSSRLHARLLCIVACLVPALGLAGPLAYVPNEKSGTVSVIDTATNQKIRDVAVGELPGSLDPLMEAGPVRQTDHGPDIMANASSQRYCLMAVALHWVLVLLVFALYGLGWYMVGIPKGTAPVAYFYNLHKSTGIVAALPIALLIWWRATHVPPPLPGTLPAWQVRAARINHLLFYVCLVVLVLSGFIESNFTKFGIKFFGYPLPILGWEDKTLYRIFNRIHVFTSYVFAALVAVHVAAAFKHLLVNRDQVLQRMRPGKSSS